MEQKTLSGFLGREIVLADYREEKSRIVEFLRNKGIAVEITKLEVADYIVSGNIAIERKSANDFINSIIDKRLFVQLAELVRYEKPLLLIEGSLQNAIILREVNSNAIYGALAAIVSEFKIPVLFSSNQIESANIIYALVKRVGKEKSEISLVKKKAQSVEDAQQLIVESLPGIGPKLAKRMLLHFGSLRAIFNASVRELMKVNGLGKEKAKKVFEVINANYKGEK